MLSRTKSKKGVSIMIGYVLLISFAVVMGILVYNWMKSYVPVDSLQCPDGTGIFIKSYSYNGTNLNVTLKNTGRFNLAGFFIHATTGEKQKVATLDISKNLTRGDTGKPWGSAILFTSKLDNSFEPNEEETYKFSNIKQIYSIDVLPIRLVTIKNKVRTVSCSMSKARQKIELTK